MTTTNSHHPRQPPCHPHHHHVYRSLNMMDEPYLMEVIKEALCFVSQDTRDDLRKAQAPGARSPFRREYVLPDGVNNLKGYVKVGGGGDGKASLWGRP